MLVCAALQESASINLIWLLQSNLLYGILIETPQLKSVSDCDGTLRSLSGWFQLYFGRFIYPLQREERRLKEVGMSGIQPEQEGYRIKRVKVEDGNLWRRRMRVHAGRNGRRKVSDVMCDKSICRDERK